MLKMLEEDALAREYESLRPELIYRIDEKNGLSEGTERGEKDCLFLSPSEIESGRAEDNDDLRGHEDSVQHTLC